MGILPSPQIILVGNKKSGVVDIKKFNSGRRGGAGVIGPQVVHSTVNISPKFPS